MKMKAFTGLFVLALCLLISGAGEAVDEKQVVMNYLAVMDFNCGTALNKESCAALTNVVIDEIVKIGKYKVVDRANRDKILSEAGFQQTGCVDEGCTIEAGRVMGVGKMVVGSITKLGTMYLLNLQLLNVQTATVELTATEECECELKGLVGASRNVSRKLMGKPDTDSPPPPAPAKTASVQMVDEKGVKLPEPPAGKALVIFYRGGPKQLFGPGAIGFKIKEGEIAIGNIMAKTCFAFATDPGKHNFWAKGDKVNDITLDLRAGETYYVEMTVAPSASYVTVRLFQATPDQAQTAIGQCSYQPAQSNIASPPAPATSPPRKVK